MGNRAHTQICQIIISRPSDAAHAMNVDATRHETIVVFNFAIVGIFSSLLFMWHCSILIYFHIGLSSAVMSKLTVALLATLVFIHRCASAH